LQSLDFRTPEKAFRCDAPRSKRNQRSKEWWSLASKGCLREQMPHTHGEGLLLIWSGLSLAAVVATAAGVMFLWGRKNKVACVDSSSTAVNVEEASSSAEQWPAGPLSVYFGSQTGTAEGFAKNLAQEAERKGFKAQVIDLEDFEPEQLASAGKAVFMMATYGEGDPTDNAASFITYLQAAETSADQRLAGKGLQYAVFGLGNRQYEHFNRTGRVTDAGLSAAGAERMFPYGEGDDDGTLEDDFDAWKEKFWAAVGPAQSAADAALLHATAAALPFTLRYVSGAEAEAAPTAESEAASSTRFYWQAQSAKVTVNRELRGPGAEGSTRHIEVDLTGTGLQYSTADNMAVLPENARAAVEQLARAQGYDLSAIVQLEYAEGHKHAFPTPCTVRAVLTRYLDICGVPRKSTVEQLLPFVQSAADKACLLQLVSKEGRDEFKAFVTEPRRTLAELLYREFKSCKLPLEQLIALVPALQSRDYTIASSSAVHPSSAHLTVAVLHSDCGGGRKFRGVCTGHLSDLNPAALSSSECRVFVRASTFRLPADDSTPIIMVGPGTGVAPMRALLQERAYRSASGSATGSAVLYFGCRRSAHDFLYREELEAAVQAGTLTALRTAFSREPGCAKVYVQDVLREHATETWTALAQHGAYVYVCGGTAMGADVQTAVADICVSEGGLSSDAAKAFLQSLQKDGRYVQELWS
jgi:NADPH-ferrihemoprotein reductase